MKKTIRNWLDTLHEPERTEALSNMRPSGITEKKDCQSEAIAFAFNWSNTPQSFEYWDDICSRINNGTYYDAPQHTPEEIEGKAKVYMREAAQGDPKPSVLPSDAAERKTYPIYSGFMTYFPHAIAAVSHMSYQGNLQHHPDKPLHWDMDKSSDELDALMRHMLEDDWEAVAWRALANLERKLTGKCQYEQAKHQPEPTK